MASPATTPDAIAQAFIDVLTPNGVPVGGIGAFTKRTPDAIYRGRLPVVQVKPLRNLHGRAMAAGGRTLGKIDEGWMAFIYRDAKPSAGRTLSQVEDAMVAARDAIVAALDGDNILSGAVTIAAEQVDEQYQPEGPFVEWNGAEFVGWEIRVSYQGTLPT